MSSTIPPPIEQINPFNIQQQQKDQQISSLFSSSFSSSSSPNSSTEQQQTEEYLNTPLMTNSTISSVISPSSASASASSSTGGSKCSVTTNPARRAPDMQMGKCPWVRVYDNVTYIVAAIALREGPEGKEVLLMREAKEKCRGKWYIPAGHVEPGETIEEAVKRELREETGLECEVQSLLCAEVRGSGWYRLAFAVQPTTENLKNEPDHESLGAGWHSLSLIRRKPCPLQLRCRDFFDILHQAERFYNWKVSLPKIILNDWNWSPILCRDEAQPGLFAEFVIVRDVRQPKEMSANCPQLSKSPQHSPRSLECLVHRCIKDQRQLLDELSLPDAFPAVEFGFEFFLPSVLSKVYRHVLADGHSVLELPEAVTAIWCLPSPQSSVRQGIRLRLICRHRKSSMRAQINAPQRYHWLELDRVDVLSSLYLLDDQFRPRLFLL
ncbi:hypothetical protein ACQ4LE_002540 [Meloidogyne hapla]|uniref:Nudix hydrolase domain-containing protein n=1 Tax=Meloidogyne hapla TaxID=6305 RepID=A0A1I8BQE5_MELHA